MMQMNAPKKNTKAMPKMTMPKMTKEHTAACADPTGKAHAKHMTAPMDMKHGKYL